MSKQLRTNRRTPFLLTTVTLCVSIGVWGAGLVNSVIINPEIRAEKQYLQTDREHSPDLQDQRMLALAYWKRYEDIRSDPYFGVHGPNGIFGARDHYKLHGKWEGRIYGPTPTIADRDLKREKDLAEAYWNRHPEVDKSSVWGRNSSLGVLGPRDHYRYVGKYQGYTWGVQTNSQENPITP